MISYFDRSTTVMNERTNTSWGVKRRHASTAGSYFLGKSSLRRELNLELACQKLTLELFVLANVRRNHSLHHFLLKQETEPEIVNASVVRDSSKFLKYFIKFIQKQKLSGKVTNKFHCV